MIELAADALKASLLFLAQQKYQLYAAEISRTI